MSQRLAASLFLALLLCVPPVFASGPESDTPPPATAAPERDRYALRPPFPALLLAETVENEAQEERSRPYWAQTAVEAETASRRVSDFSSLLLNDDIVAYYGSPRTSTMGILGAHPLPELDSLLAAQAAEYDAANGDRGVKRAFYIIYGTAWPGGEIGLLAEKRLLEYIEYALANDILVFVDHQIGKYTVAEAMRRILPFLRYPNVHLALDPEWRTTKPMEEIGFVTADEINQAQATMQNYIVEHGYPGERMLVIHQFHWKMISGRPGVRADFPRVRLVHCADGFGSPALKRQSYAHNAQAGNIPVKGFKLFYKTDVRGAGYDTPLMAPAEVFGLDPRPYLIMYQ